MYANIQANRCQPGVTAANCQYNFAYFGPNTGTFPLPITLAYFLGNSSGYSASLTAGALGQVGSVTSPAAGNTLLYSSTNFRSTAYLTSLSQLNPNVVGWGTALRSTTAAQIARGIAAGLPANFFQVNPLNYSGGSWVIENTSKSWYDAAVIEVRRRLSQGLRVQASYVFSKSQANGYAVSSTIGSSALSSRGLGDDLAKTLQPFDLRHNFKVDATYDLPFGRGRTFFSNSGKLVNALVGGFSILPLVTWTSGSPIALGNVALVGMTVKELEKAVKIHKNAFSMTGGVPTSTQVVTWLPDDIILNSQRAFAVSITSPNGYSSTFGALPNNAGGIPPTGRYIAPAW